MPRWPDRPAQFCLTCGKQFAIKRNKYCSRECYGGNRSGNRRFVESRTGYIVITKGTWRQYEHRQVMEKSLGRKLRPEESIHHKDGNKGNNSLANLELWSKKHLGGQRTHEQDIWSGNIAPYHFNAV